MSAAAETVIGGIILGGKDAYWRIADVVRADHFASPLHAELFALLADMAEGKADIDVITVGDEAERRGLCDGSVVTGLASNTFSFANIRGHAEIVRDDATDRRFKAICKAGARDGDIAETQRAIGDLLQSRPASVVPLKSALKRMWAGVQERYASGEEITGLRTGYPEIDEMTGGLQPGRVYGIGARAKMGKTILAMNICGNVACPPKGRDGELLWQPKHVAAWSLEMSEDELAQRMTSAAAGVSSSILQRPKLMDRHEEASAKLSGAIARLNAAPMVICDTLDISIEEIEAQARQLKGEGKLDLLCIDHLGLLRSPKKERHDLAVAHNTRRIKSIAKTLNIPVILVFQLNRGSEKGTAVRPPMPSDARDSGSIEQDLDVMMLLHRPSYYDKSGSAKKGLRLDLALNRIGPTGLMELEDQLEFCRFMPTGRPWVDSNGPSGSYDDL